MVKVTGLIIFTVQHCFSLRGAGIQCFLHGITSVFLCVPFLFLTAKSVDLVVAHDGILHVLEICNGCIFIVATFLAEVLSLIYSAV